MREAGGQRIGKSCPDAQHRICAFNRLFYRASTRRATVRTVKTGLPFIEYSFTHQHGGVCHRHLFHPFLQRMFNAVAQDKEIGQQRSTFARFQPALGGITERFQAGIIAMNRFESESAYRRRSRFFSHIGRQHQVAGTALPQHGGEHSVDFVAGILFGQDRLCDRDRFTHMVEVAELTITQRVVQQLPFLL